MASSDHYDPDVNAMFPSKEYLKRFVDPLADPMKVHIKFLDAYHQFYTKYLKGTTGPPLSLLEFGGGPTLHSLMTACRYVGSISFADYAESNRNEIIMWRDQTSGGEVWCASQGMAFVYV